MRLGRYALYGVLIAFGMYLGGVWYTRRTINADLLNQVAVPLVAWGVFAGVIGGALVMGLEAFAGLIKRKWPTRHRP